MGRISSSEGASLGSNRFQLPQERQHENLNNQAQVVQTLDSAIQWINHYPVDSAISFPYYIHFEIIGYPCNLIGSQQCDLFLNRTIFCAKSHLFQIASFMF